MSPLSYAYLVEININFKQEGDMSYYDDADYALATLEQEGEEGDGGREERTCRNEPKTHQEVYDDHKCKVSSSQTKEQTQTASGKRRYWHLPE